MQITFVLYVFTLASITCLHAQNPTLAVIEEFIETNFPEFPLVDVYSSCSFEHSCLPEVTPFLNIGICMLHSFWPSEALRAYLQAVQIDGNCSIAYWGIYKALQWDNGYVQGRIDALSLANQTAPLATEREQLYVLAELPGSDWNATYHIIMQNYPQDLNAQTLWAWDVVDSTVNYLGDPLPYREVAQVFLQNFTKYYPTFAPGWHYTIHAWEDTLTPDEALGAAEILPKLINVSGHDLHMPAHVYYLIGEHDTAQEIFLSAYNLDLYIMSLYGRTFQDYWEFIHNLGYLTLNLGVAGQYSEALTWGRLLQQLQVNWTRPSLLEFSPVINRAAARYFHQGLVASPLIYFQYSQWLEAALNLDNLINVVLPPVINNTDYSWIIQYYQALQQYSWVMAHAENGNLQSATNHYNALTSLVVELNTTLGSEASEFSYSVGGRAYAALVAQYFEASGWIYALNGEINQAIQTFITANTMAIEIPYNEPPIISRPVLSSLFELYIQLAGSSSSINDTVNYLNLALNVSVEIASASSKNPGFALLQQGQAYQLLNQTQNALDVYGQLVNNYWKNADSNLPQLVSAQLFLLQHEEAESESKTVVTALAVLVALFGAFNIIFIVYIYASRRNRAAFGEKTQLIRS